MGSITEVDVGMLALLYAIVFCKCLTVCCYESDYDCQLG